MLKQAIRWMTEDVRGLAGLERTLVTVVVALLVQLAVHAWGANWRVSTWVFVGTLLALATARAVVHLLRKQGIIKLAG